MAYPTTFLAVFRSQGPPWHLWRFQRLGNVSPCLLPGRVRGTSESLQARLWRHAILTNTPTFLADSGSLRAPRGLRRSHGLAIVRVASSQVASETPPKAFWADQVSFQVTFEAPPKAFTFRVRQTWATCDLDQHSYVFYCFRKPPGTMGPDEIARCPCPWLPLDARGCSLGAADVPVCPLDEPGCPWVGALGCPWVPRKPPGQTLATCDFDQHSYVFC